MSMDPNQGGQDMPPPPGGPGYPPPQGYPPPPPGYPPPGYPPPGAYPPPNAGYAAPQAPVPAGYANFFQKWRNVTTHPGAPAFAAELPTANWADIWIGLLILGVISAIAGFIRLAEGQAATNAIFNSLPAAQRQIFNGFTTPSPTNAFASIITVPIGFFILMGIFWLFAKMFGGTGTFLQQSYAYSLFYIPVFSVAAIVGIIPFLGGLVAFALFIYGIVLAIYSIMASHHLTGGRATAVVLLPAAILAVLACILVFALAALLVAVFRNAYPGGIPTIGP